jgi:hypothetical protein
MTRYRRPHHHRIVQQHTVLETDNGFCCAYLLPRYREDQHALVMALPLSFRFALNVYDTATAMNVFAVMRDGLPKLNIAHLINRQPVHLTDRAAIHVHQHCAFGDQLLEMLLDQIETKCFFCDRPFHVLASDQIGLIFFAQ